MPSPEHNLAHARRYLTALERGVGGDELAAFFTPDVVQEELPNRLSPTGVTRDLAAVLEGAERGRKVVEMQRYEVLGEIAQGDRVALEVAWSATLKVPIGALAQGAVMKARFAVFLDYRDGKIASQRNYDCFDPF